MSVNSDTEVSKKCGCEKEQLTGIECHVVRVFRQLNEERQQDILRFLDALLKNQ